MPTWLTRKNLTVFFNMAALSGKWYFYRTLGKIVEQLRDHEDAKTLDLFVTAFAKAV